MLAHRKFYLILAGLLACVCVVVANPEDKRLQKYRKSVRPIMKKHCYSCHNGEDNKAGINLERYDFIIAIERDGELFYKVMEAIRQGSMPPDIRPPMAEAEKDTFIHYISSYLERALAKKDPGLIPPRRLNNQEYHYAIKDLLGVSLHVDSLFPADPSGGAGFNNQARTLYVSPILMERYFEAAELALEKAQNHPTHWRKMIPPYRNSLGAGIRNVWYKIVHGKDVSVDRPLLTAQKVLYPFAIRAYKRFLSTEDKDRIDSFFKEVYMGSADKEDRYDYSVRETMKLILMSHQFLYRTEADPEVAGNYPVSNFELASRLSFFLWSSIPDMELLEVAYREDLHDPEVLEGQINRMLSDPKSRRMGSQFALQWLELTKLKDPTFQLDPEIYPEYNATLRDIMLKEIEVYFNHVMLESKNILELLDSDYSFVNRELANHYDIKGVEGEELEMVCFEENKRGGLLGMAGVLTATSLPTRTSPVLRGKWVLEQIFGTPAPPPPADVPELEESHDSAAGPLSLREAMFKHMEDPACKSCHLAMDPIGLGLENFDGIGRWRDSYDSIPIDPAGVLKTGESFNSPMELRQIMLDKKELFAKNFSKKMLSYALGRGIVFKDSPTVDHLQKTLLESNFNSTAFLRELILSFPFRYKKSDNKDGLET